MDQQVADVHTNAGRRPESQPLFTQEAFISAQYLQ